MMKTAVEFWIQLSLSAPVLIVSHLTRHDCVTLKFARKIIHNATNISRDVYFCEDARTTWIKNTNVRSCCN